MCRSTAPLQQTHYLLVTMHAAALSFSLADADGPDLYSGGVDAAGFEEEGPAGEGGSEGGALGEVTNRLAAAHLSGAAGPGTAGACEHDSPPPAAQQRWGVAAGAGAGAGGMPRTTMKAMAPMTAAKALMRADTPSSLASPEAMSPSMRCGHEAG